MEMHADLCIKSFNDAAKISGVNVMLEPKYGHRENEYNETISMNDTLHEMRQGPHMNQEADLYVMITDHFQGTAPSQLGHCGLGFLNSEPSRRKSFFVVDISCSVASLSFAQLVGQNFGCKHDRGTEDDCKSTDDYNYGYRDPQGRYRDIMALPCQPGQCDNLPNETDCTRLPMFSNDLGYLYKKSLPDGGVEQLPVGNWKASCARRMNDVAAAIAGFSDATTSPSNRPTLSPTLSQYPSPYPTRNPSSYPTRNPSPYPTRNPSPYPTPIPDPPRVYSAKGGLFGYGELDYEEKVYNNFYKGLQKFELKLQSHRSIKGIGAISLPKTTWSGIYGNEDYKYSVTIKGVNLPAGTIFGHKEFRYLSKGCYSTQQESWEGYTPVLRGFHFEFPRGETFIRKVSVSVGEKTSICFHDMNLGSDEIYADVEIAYVHNSYVVLGKYGSIRGRGFGLYKELDDNPPNHATPVLRGFGVEFTDGGDLLGNFDDNTIKEISASVFLGNNNAVWGEGHLNDGEKYRGLRCHWSYAMIKG
eukprot:scaffold2813_cov114-Cylindrotheca_fusiformis.AAC.8